MALEYKSSLGRYRRYLQSVENQPLMAQTFWVILSLVLLIVMLTAALRPTLITIADLMAQIRDKKELSTQLDNKIVAVQKALETLQQKREEILLLDEAIPEEAEWSKLADRIFTAASNSGAKVTNLELGPIGVNSTNKTGSSHTLPTGVKSYNFSGKLSGSYENMRKTIAEIENLRRIIILTKVEIDNDPEKGLVLAFEGVAGYDIAISKP